MAKNKKNITASSNIKKEDVNTDVNSSPEDNNNENSDITPINDEQVSSDTAPANEKEILVEKPKASQPKKNKFKKIILTISNILVNLFFVSSIIIILFTVTTVVLNKGDAQNSYFLGYKPFVAISGSMEPAIKQYGLVFIKQCDYDDLNINDIATFSSVNSFVTHRIVDSVPDGFVTKGDNNSVTDSNLLTANNVVGKVVYILNFISVPLRDILGENGQVRFSGICKWLILPFSIIALLSVIVSYYKNRDDLDDSDDLDVTDAKNQ